MKEYCCFHFKYEIVDIYFANAQVRLRLRYINALQDEASHGRCYARIWTFGMRCTIESSEWWLALPKTEIVLMRIKGIPTIIQIQVGPETV